MNPLFSNDPVLYLLMERFHPNPISLLYFTFLAFPVVLLIWSALDRTLFLKPSTEDLDTHGFISPINSYFIVLPFINYAIFSYYEGYDMAIQALFNSGILADGFGASDFFEILDHAEISLRIPAPFHPAPLDFLRFEIPQIFPARKIVPTYVRQGLHDFARAARFTFCVHLRPPGQVLPQQNRN